MADKRKKGDDLIVVKVYGREIEIPRGDMNDSEWNDLKAKHAKTQQRLTRSEEMISPSESPEARVARKDAEWEEETGDVRVTARAVGKGATSAAAGASRIRAEAEERVEKAKKTGNWDEVTKEDLIQIGNWTTESSGGPRGIKRFVGEGIKGALGSGGAGGEGGSSGHDLDAVPERRDPRKGTLEDIDFRGTGGGRGRDNPPTGGKGGRDLDSLIKTRDEIDAAINTLSKYSSGSGGGSEIPNDGSSGRERRQLGDRPVDEVPERRGSNVGKREALPDELGSFAESRETKPGQSRPDSGYRPREELPFEPARQSTPDAGRGELPFSPSQQSTRDAGLDRVPERRGANVGSREEISGDLPPLRESSVARDVGSFVGGTVRAAANPLGEIDRALGTEINPDQFEKAAGNMIGGTVNLLKQGGEALGEFGAGLMNPGSSAPAPMQGPAYQPHLLNGPPSAPPPGRQSPVGPPPTTVGPGGGSVSVGVKGTVQGGAGSGIPGYPSQQLLTDNNNVNRERAAALSEAANIESYGKQKIADAEADYANKLEQHQRDILARQEAGNARAEKIFAAVEQAQKVLNDKTKTPDPERYWKNHSKLLFAIGVGLLAANKRDIGAVLGNVQNAIKNDIDAQQAEFEAPKKAAKDSLAANQQLYGMLRLQGHDDFEAKKMAQVLLSQQMQVKVRAMADASDSELVKANARDAIARLQQDEIRFSNEVAQHAKSLGIQEYNALTQRREANAKIAANSGAGGRKLTEQERKAALMGRQGIETIRELREVLGPPKGLMGAMKESASANVPLIETDAKSRQRAISALNFKLATAISQSALQSHEQKFWVGEDGKGGVLGNVGLSNMTQAQLDALERDLMNSVKVAETGELTERAGAGGGGSGITMGPPR